MRKNRPKNISVDGLKSLGFVVIALGLASCAVKQS